MTDHPITPPPKLFKQCEGMPRSLAFEAAYRAGADQELEACCGFLQELLAPSEWITGLRAARRPKPPTLAEKALKALQDQIDTSFKLSPEAQERANTIRAALIRLQELEQLND